MASTISAGTTSGTAIAITGDTSGALSLLTNNGTTAVTIDTSQNVGIGTSSPAVKLDVNSSAAGGNVATFRSTATNGGYVFFQGSGSSPTATGYVGAASKLNTGGSVTDFGMTAVTNLVFGTNDGTERMRILSDGKVAIGGTTEFGGARLTVYGNGLSITNGSLYRLAYQSGDTNFYFSNGTNQAFLSGAGAWTNASDARLKTNIRDIEYGLNAVLMMQPRHYERVDVDGTYVGFVAQELQTVIPEVVSGDPEKQLGVDYGSLVAVAFKAIQEQQTLIENLTTRLNALEEK